MGAVSDEAGRLNRGLNVKPIKFEVDCFNIKWFTEKLVIKPLKSNLYVSPNFNDSMLL